MFDLKNSKIMFDKKIELKNLFKIFKIKIFHIIILIINIIIIIVYNIK